MMAGCALQLSYQNDPGAGGRATCPRPNPCWANSLPGNHRGSQLAIDSFGYSLKESRRNSRSVTFSEAKTRPGSPDKVTAREAGRSASFRDEIRAPAVHEASSS